MGNIFAEALKKVGFEVNNEYIPCQIFDYFEGKNYPIIPLNSNFNGG